MKEFLALAYKPEKTKYTKVELDGLQTFMDHHRVELAILKRKNDKQFKERSKGPCQDLWDRINLQIGPSSRIVAGHSVLAFAALSAMSYISGSY